MFYEGLSGFGFSKVLEFRVYNRGFRGKGVFRPHGLGFDSFGLALIQGLGFN